MSIELMKQMTMTSEYQKSNDIPLNFGRKYNELLQKQDNMLRLVDKKLRTLESQSKTSLMASPEKIVASVKKRRKKYFLEETRILHEKAVSHEMRVREMEMTNQKNKKTIYVSPKKEKLMTQSDSEDEENASTLDISPKEDKLPVDEDEELVMSGSRNPSIEPSLHDKSDSFTLEAIPEEEVPTEGKYPRSKEEVIGDYKRETQERELLAEEEKERLVLEEKKNKIEKMIQENKLLLEKIKTPKKKTKKGYMKNTESIKAKDTMKSSRFEKVDVTESEINALLGKTPKKKKKKKKKTVLDALSMSRREKTKLREKLMEKLKMLEKVKQDQIKEKQRILEAKEIEMERQRMEVERKKNEKQRRREKNVLTEYEKRRQLITLQISLLLSKSMELEQEHDIILAEIKNPGTRLNGREMKVVKTKVNGIKKNIATLQKKIDEYKVVAEKDRLKTKSFVENELRTSSWPETEDATKLKELEHSFRVNTKRVNELYPIRF